MRLRAAGIVALLLLISLPLGEAHAGAPTCFGEPATIVGTPGDDEIRGSDDRSVVDVIVALGGDDLIFLRGRRWLRGRVLRH